MTTKRYAIVRVDGVCPIYNDKAFNRKSKNFCYRFNCSNCLYGDTKEQLILKVLQVMRRNHLGWCNMTRIAKEIVEFLGVKDDK